MMRTRTTGMLHAIELDLMASQNREWAAERREAVQDYDRGLKRRVLIELNRYVTNNPTKGRGLVAKIARSQGFEFVGMGVDSIVYKHTDEQNVKKVHVKTSLQTPDQQQHEVSFRNDEFAMLETYIGGLTLPQKTFVGDHPVTGANPLVQTKQVHCDITNEISYFTPCGGQLSVLSCDLQKARRVAPFASDMVHDFVRGAQAMYRDTSFLPDTNGPGNLAFGYADGGDMQLFLIDGKPVGPDHAMTQETILAQLDALERVA